MSDVTRILAQIDSGNAAAADELLPQVYDELRKLAAARLRQEKPGQTLQATALVHEAYLRLVGKPGANSQDPVARSQKPEDANLAPGQRLLAPGHWSSRGHFFAAAAEAMRRILIEQVRLKRARKAGGDYERVELVEIAVDARRDPLDLLALDEALQKLERNDPRKAQLVKLRYFAGLTIEQAAEALGVAPSTANADWVYAKSWLRLEMRSDD